MLKVLKIIFFLGCFLNTLLTFSQVLDHDADLIVDSIDIDDDNDGIPDNTEQYPNCEGSTVYNWVTWNTISDNIAQGVINTNGKTINVTVTHSNGGMLQTNGMYSGDVFPSNLNVPINNLSIANSNAGIFTITFSEPVSNPLFAFSSVGNPGTSVPVVTSKPYTIVWQGQGVNYTSSTEFIGTEGHNLIQIPEVGTTFSFEYKTSEYYCNIAFGAKDIINCSGVIADTDNDGIPNYLDLDSDGDGCSDALEAGATTSKLPNYTFSGPFGQNGMVDILETTIDDGKINYFSKYIQNALNKFVGQCVFLDSDNDGIEDDDDLDDDNDGVLDTDEGKCTNDFVGFVPTTFEVFKYDLGIPDYETPTKKLNPAKLALSGVYSPPIPGKVDWRLSDASMHIGFSIPFNQYQYKNGYTSEPNVNITIFRVIVPKGFKNVSQSITRFGVDGGTNIWKNGVMIDGMCCGDEGGPPAPITTTYTVNSGDTIEFRSVNGRPVHQSTNFEFTKIIGKCTVPDDYDTDGDGIVNRLDTDSDGDGCSDAFESGATLNKTPSNFTFSGPFGANGYKDSLETSTESGTINYNLTYQKAIDSTYAMCNCPFGIEGMFPTDTLAFCNTANIDAGAGFNYKWKDGSTSQILVTNQTGKTFVNVGKSGCHYTDTLFVHVLSSGLKPKDTVICDGNSIQLKADLTSLSSYPSLTPTISWSPSETGTSIMIKPRVDTTVYCTLKNNLLSCKDSVFIDVVKGKAKINQLNQLVCANDSVILKSDTAKTYLWSTNASTRSIQIGRDTKIIVLQVIDTLGCMASDTLTFDFQLTPILWNVVHTNVSCFQSKDGVVDLNPTGGVKPYSFLWSDGTTNNILRNLDKGIVSVSITDANGCKKDTVFRIIEPQLPLTISSVKTNIQCVGDVTGNIDVTTSGGTLPYSFAWNSGQIVEDISNLDTGNYVLIVTDKNGCQISKSDTIKALHPLPLIDAGKDTSICLRDSIFLKASGALVYTWQPYGINLTSVFPSVGITKFIVTGKDQNNCIGIDTLSINVLDLPKVDAGKDTILCEGAQLKLNSGGNANKYQWSDNVFDNQLFTPNIGSKEYILTGFDINNCKNSDTVKISVFQFPTIKFSVSDSIGCSPLSVNIELEGKETLTSFNWYVDDIAVDSTNIEFQKDFTSIGCHKIELVAENRGCISKVSNPNAVCIVDNPIADFKVDTTDVTLQSPTVQFTNLSTNADQYLWNFDDDSISNLLHLTHTFPQKVTDFVVTLYALKDFKNCIDSHKVIIHVRDDLILYCPNAFTPDGDNLNEVFKPVITAGIAPEKYTFTIFNRWGQIVFETHDKEKGWDGTYNKNLLAPDIYTYVIWFQDLNNQEGHRINGHVSLLR
jgi:gliding motility-associated-like protein